MKKLYYHKFKINDHTYLLAATNNGLFFVGSQDRDVAELKKFYPEVELIDDLAKLQAYEVQLAEYLNGERQEFTIPTDISGTEFQNSVWGELSKIPYGQTTDYSKLAIAIGRPNSYRAVGTAVGKNPLLMVIPCHRVLSKNQTLGGYRGGLEMKRQLLKLEGNL